jgi:glycosyltransferase involved in cell wall biosynthesis
MNIWIVNPYGTLPSEGWRHYRSYMLAKALEKRGHTITWWMSNFEHRTKSFRSALGGYQLLVDGVSVILVDSPSYSRNISLGRLLYEKKFGEKFYELAKSQTRPDLIVIAEPSIFYCKQVVKFVEDKRIKLVVDVLDLWPELFAILLPPFLRRFHRIFFFPLYYRRKKLLEAADGIVTVTADYMVKISKTLNSTPKQQLVSYLGVDVAQFDNDARNGDLPELLTAFSNKFSGLTAVYAGTLGDAYDMETLIESIELCISRKLNVRFIIAGSGPKVALIEQVALKYPLQICYLGTVNANILPKVYQFADVGLCTYSKGSTVSMPVKLYDYLAAGLVVVNSLDGEIRELVVRKNIGLNYAAGDPDSLFQQLAKLLEKPGLVAEIKLSANRMSSNFDSAAQHRRFAEFIEQL